MSTYYDIYLDTTGIKTKMDWSSYVASLFGALEDTKSYLDIDTYTPDLELWLTDVYSDEPQRYNNHMGDYIGNYSNVLWRIENNKEDFIYCSKLLFKYCSCPLNLFLDGEDGTFWGYEFNNGIMSKKKYEPAFRCSYTYSDEELAEM